MLQTMALQSNYLATMFFKVMQLGYIMELSKALILQN